MQAVIVGNLCKELLDPTRAPSLGEDLARRAPAELHAWPIEPVVRPRLVAEYANGKVDDVDGIVAMHKLNGNVAAIPPAAHRPAVLPRSLAGPPVAMRRRKNVLPVEC